MRENSSVRNVLACLLSWFVVWQFEKWTVLSSTAGVLPPLNCCLASSTQSPLDLYSFAFSFAYNLCSLLDFG